MVKTRFPGKPAKHFNRRRVSGVNSDGNEGITAAEDVYRRLSLFYSLFHTDDEDNNFHGFSPHEIDLKSSNQNTTPSGSKQIKKKKRVQCSPRKLNISSLNNRGDSKEQITDEKDVPNSLTELKKDFGLDSEKSKTESFSDSSKHVNSKDNIPSNTTLSGKFVLPSRSVHSSRVIKPNKRFLQNDTTPVPYKRSRLGVSSDIRDPDLGTYSLNQKNSESHMKTDISAFDQRKSSVGPGKSPVKFVLRKPRLKIKTQTLPVVGGPFSSPGGNSLNLQGLRNPRPSLTKVFCGVCGALRTCKLFRQAQKFGIFCCDMCRKFILRMIRSERDKSLLPLNCSSGNGNCPIRQNSLIAQGFPNDSSEKDFDEQERCEACWLNWCLKSFDMPQKLVKRLSNFLPVNVIQKPILSFSKVPGTDWRDIHKSTLTEQSKTNIKLGATNIEPRLGRRNKGIRENINIRRASNMSLRLSSHRGRGLRDYEDTKKGRGRQKLPVTGPRVKHVCRSASLVLGQPVATFDPIVGSKGGAAVNNIEEKIQNEAHEETINILDSELQINSDNEKVKHTQSQESDVSPIEQADVDFPPVARMLQDLGRANCELLDGIENHEFERQNARVSIDFWESYDPEEVSQMGFPLIGFSPLKLRALCFLCGSAGLEKMVHCASCCEPYHTFCVSNVSINQSGDWWQLDWLCPKCTKCEACLKTGGTQLSCTKCKKSYHSNCISSMRINIYDNNWVCPSCLFCKSCNGSSVHVFVGNMPLCKSCFKLRKRGNFCPLCQCCYDDNDYNTKMMECAKCQCWIHANCEGISNEKYQVLSYLPSSIEFICKLCCDDPPAAWSLAVNAELKAGYLNVIKILSKNRNACAMFKASPKKQRLCVCSDKHRNPIHLPNLISGVETEDGFNIDSPMGTSPDRDYKSSDLGLLTPKLTKDDEESLKTVKTDFLNLVAEKDKTKDLLDKPVSKKSEELLSANKNSQLLSIVYNKLVSSEEMSTADNLIDKDNILLKDKSNQSNPDRVCTCQISESSQYQPLSLLSVKNKANNDEYRSVFEFHSDMECVMKEIGNCDLITTYSQSLKQIFPWFNIDESTVLDTSLTERESLGNNKVLSPRPSEKQSLKKNEEFTALKGLLNLEQDCYYMGLSFQETRMCLFCKMVGEGNPKREGRLLYCGQNEWVHANCALWSSEVFEEIDGSLQNVHSAVSRARLIRCVHCEKKGASLGCCAKSCPSAYHFSCALLADCILLETKEIYCKAHSNLRNGKEIHYDDDFLIKRSVYVELDRKKKKDVLRNQVRIYIGSLEVCQIGEILPEFSDYSDVIIPCDFKCSRLYWSCKEPWKIVRYSIQTKVTNMLNEYSYENDTNYTVDHSLEFTPPPSPVEFNKNNSNASPDFCEKEIKAVVNQIIDTICSKEEDNTINDQQNTDILPPELTDAIFDDLPKDFLDRITVHDIFTKMSFDDMLLSESQSIREASDCSTHLDPLCNKLKVQNDNTKEKNNKPTNLYKVVRAVKQNAMDKMKDCEMLLDSEKVNKWKRSSIIQVDGAMDFSESDQSNDSCDLDLNNKVLTDNCEINEDNPVKCSRCHRTYRTNLSYERHLTTCNADYLSGSESECSEEEKTQGGETEDSTSIDLNITHLNHSSSQINSDSQVHLFNVPVEVNTIAANSQNIQTVVQNSFENSMICVNNSNFNGVRESSESILNINYSSINNDIVQNTGYRNDQTLVTSVDTVVSEPVVNLQQPTIFLQQMPSDNVLPSAFVSTPFQEQQSNIQYITAINTQEKTQYLSTNSIGSTTYHIQPSLPQSVVQNVPTVVGTIVQSNGVEQIVLNNPGTGLDVYGHQQNNMYISNTPMIVGMETVVSNTVMSSSRFISGAAPGMLASSYSATTTQVFQAAKPVIDIPQSYVVVNSPIVENNGTCVQNIIQNGSLSNPSWNGYKISYQDALKLNKNVTYQTVSQQIVAQKQDINGVKIVNPSDHTILVTPSSVKVGRAGLPSVREKINVQNVPCVNNCKNGNSKQPNPVKVVELPFSSANHREKPQQAVAPVVIKKVIEPTQVKETFPNQSICKRDVNNKVESPCQVPFTNLQETNPSTPGTTKLMEAPPNKEMNHVPENKSTIIQDISTPSIIVPSKLKEPKEYEPMKLNGSEILKKRKIVHEEPKISFEISSDDGFSFNTTSLNDAWNTVFETVQKARKAKNLPPLTQNPFSSPDSMLKKLMGLGNNSMKYLLEQLPGISSCSKYKPVYHKKIPSALEKELSKGKTLNPSGCARTEPFRYTHKTYDMFSWLASRHRRPPKLHSDTDGLNGNSRRATSMNLPMAMRFRHLKETSKASVGVFRSDIHGRGLFCLRDIDAGEMVIEYAGEVIRSALTDKRERYYTEKGIGCYMFRIDDKFVVDATMKGNAARFINHSCEPNCYSRVIDILGKKHILIFAHRKILQGEELTYDYKFPLEEDKINCHCLSRKCRKYLN